MKQIIYMLFLYVFSFTQAVALSCVRPDVVERYLNSVHSEHSVVILKGTISFKQPVWKKQQTFETLTTQGQFDGFMLHHRGFEIPYSEPITLIFECFAEWCGSLAAEEEIIAFAAVEDFELRLRVQPCNFTVFPVEFGENAQRLLGCHLQGQCH
ncbi:hypothetical protein UM181_15850 [Alphaproteobacteria bacterium US3C007]|jgi:hypothetical protein|nr:hypothetical protein UM181_15850 [Alphaproteobacteria bacterium US3C007]